MYYTTDIVLTRNYQHVIYMSELTINMLSSIRKIEIFYVTLPTVVCSFELFVMIIIPNINFTADKLYTKEQVCYNGQYHYYNV